MKLKNKMIMAGIVLGVSMILFIALYYIFTIIENYIILAFHGLILSLNFVKSQAQPVKLDYSFKAAYFQPPKGIHWHTAASLSLAFLSVFSHKIVLRISNKIAYLFHLSGSDDSTSHWASRREIKRDLTAIPRGAVTEAIEAGVVLASDRKNYYADTQTVNTFTIGTTRSGKSQLIVLYTIWLISQCKKAQSFISFDLKGELVEYSYSFLVPRYGVYVLNFMNPSHSSRYNPLAIIILAYVSETKAGGEDYSQTVDLTRELAHIITNNPKSDPVWPACAKSLLEALILYLIEDAYKRDCLDKVNMYSVYNFFIEYGGREIHVGRRVVNALDELLSKLPIGHPAKMAYASSKFANGEMRSSIFSTLASNLEIFGDAGIARMTSGNDIDFRKLIDPDKPCAIFMVVPDNKKTRYKLATLFVSQCYAQLVEYSNEFPRKMLPQRVRFILDELGNMPSILDFSTKITSGLGHNILFDLYVQAMAQLEERYGRYTAATIQGNCGNWIYLNSLDKDTNKYFSEQLGNSSAEYKTYSAENGEILDRSRQSHSKSRPLKTHDELPRLPFKKIITLRQRCYPILSTMKPFYKLNLPVVSLDSIQMQKNIVSLKDVLYPLDQLSGGKTVKPADKGVSQSEAGEAKAEHIKLQSVINNINILSHAEFGQALERGDLDTCQKLIDRFIDEQRLSEEQAELLEDFIQEK